MSDLTKSVDICQLRLRSVGPGLANRFCQHVANARVDLITV
jgi:hypothetical protein